MKKLTKISWMITLALGVIVFSCKEDDTVPPSIVSKDQKVEFTNVERTKKQEKSITITLRGLTTDVAVTIEGKGFSVDKKTISSKKSQETLKISYLADLNTPKGTHKGTLTLKSGSAKLAIPLEASIDKPREVFIKSNLNSDYLSLGYVSRGKKKIKEITISTQNLTEDVKIKIEGEGYSVDKTSIPASKTEEKIVISFSGNRTQAVGDHSGKLTISSGNIIYTLVLNVVIGRAESGYFIVNEGTFGKGNTSISYFDKNANFMNNEIFKTSNKRPLGDQAQSMTIIDDKGYIVVQASDKIEVINTSNFGSITTIKDLPSPRYIIKAATDKAYISDWGADGKTGTIQVLNLKTNKVTGTIKTGKGPNEMVLVGTKVYVANVGGWAADKTVQVIDTNTDKILKTIEVGDNSKSIVADDNGAVWVAGRGKVVYNPWPTVDQTKSTPSFIAKIVNDAVEVTYKFPIKGTGPTDIEINTTGTALFYNYNGKLYTSQTNEFVKGKKPTLKVFTDKKFYGIDLDPSTDHVLGFEAPNFTSSGKMYRYNSTGGLIDSYTVGIGPNGAGM